MSDIPDALRYTNDHEYVKATDDADVVIVGITDYAQGELGDIVYVELPEVGETFAAGKPFGTIEAVKAVADLLTPANGEVIEVNGAVADEPSVINQDPYGGGWMIKLRVEDPSDLDHLLSPGDYAEHIGE